jgi:hypothetical protein
VNDPHSLDLFADVAERPGALGCAVEIAAVLASALEASRARGLSREAVAQRMSFHLGERISEPTIDGYASQAHAEREISLRRAMALDAALGEDVFLGLFAAKRGGRQVVSADDFALLELARLQQEEKRLAERKRALQALLTTTRRAK